MFRYIFVVSLAVVHLINFAHVSSKDVSSGLKCITLSDNSKTRICTGTNENYDVDREIARKNKTAISTDIQTRFFRPPCRGVNQCTAFQQTYSPTLLQNKFGQDRYIYQDDDFGFAQTVRVVTCGAGVCGNGGQCKQTYRDYVLIAWDPYLDYCNPVTDVFSIPDCCGCSEQQPIRPPPVWQCNRC